MLVLYKTPHLELNIPYFRVVKYSTLKVKQMFRTSVLYKILHLQLNNVPYLSVQT
jgi:hypothetical protein